MNEWVPMGRRGSKLSVSWGSDSVSCWPEELALTDHRVLCLPTSLSTCSRSSRLQRRPTSIVSISKAAAHSSRLHLYVHEMEEAAKRISSSWSSSISTCTTSSPPSPSYPGARSNWSSASSIPGYLGLRNRLIFTKKAMWVYGSPFHFKSFCFGDVLMVLAFT